MNDYQPLLERLTQRMRDENPKTPAGKLTALEIEAEATKLGYPLHPLLAAAYGHVADGGFGPEYQLLTLAEAVDTYLSKRTTNAGTEWAWPEGVLPILTWGCAMYAAVDCRDPEGRVLLFEPNPGDPEQAWFVDSASLAAWFEHYLDDDGWWNLVEAGEDVGELEPWNEARGRA